MCQKATGGLFGPYVTAPADGLVWTRGSRKRFQSSNKVQRGFCGACGSPLTFEFEGASVVGLAIGALDRPGDVRITEQLASRARISDFAQLAALPEHPEDEPRAAAYLAGIVSCQHPDHDTDDWAPRT